MSVYGGFATKKQSCHYFTIVEDIIKIMQVSLMDSFAQNLAKYSNFRSIFLELYDKLKKLELRKYMQPKYSITLQPLFTMCFDHQYFIHNNNISEQQFEESEQNIPQRSFRTIRDIEESMSQNHRSLVKQSIPKDDQSSNIHGIDFRWRENKISSKQSTMKKWSSIITNATNEVNAKSIQIRPNTTGETGNRNKSFSIGSRTIALKFDRAIQSRKAIYQSFQKDYVLPAPPSEYQKKLNKLRRSSKIKYSIDQLF